MEFYDKVNDNYLNMLKHPIQLWRVKLEILDHYENTIMCIEKDIDYSNAGSISCNNTQGTRKSCSITLINVSLDYIPTEDSPFWFNRKFRLYVGLVDNRHYKQGDIESHWTNETDTYWFSKGVYITQDIHVDSVAHTVIISGVDKFAQLDGSLNVLQADEMNTVFEYGAPIRDVIQDILTLDLGNGQVLDPIEPLIDEESLNTVYLYKEFMLSAGQYYGDFLSELATSYGADVFYDNVGRLVFRRMFADDFPYWIEFKAPALEVKYHLPGYQNPQESLKLTGVNKIIVSTDNVETPNASYTAINTNPRSPLCYNKIGARTLPENGGVVIINAGNIVTKEDTERDPTLKGEGEELVRKRCQDYAEYRLMQETCLGTSITFNSAPYLHLNEGDVIAVTDPDFGLDCDLYIINSITFPLGADSIQIEMSNLGFLNSDISSQNQYSGLTNQPIRFGIHYIVGEVTGTPPANQSVEIDTNFTTANDYDETTHTVSFSKENHELMSWTDNIHQDTYELGASYPVPHQHFTMRANWVDYSDYIAEFRIRNIAGAGYTYGFNSLITEDSDSYSAAILTIDDNKYYLWGRGQSTVPLLINPMPSEGTFKYIYVPKIDNPTYTFSSVLGSMIPGGTAGGRTYYVKFPDVIQSLDFTSYCYSSYLEIMILPKSLQTLNYYYALENHPNIKMFDFNNDNEVTFDMGTITKFLVDCPVLTEVAARNHVTFLCGNTSDTSQIITAFNEGYLVPDLNFEGGLTLAKKQNVPATVQLHLLNFYQPASTARVATINIGNSSTVQQDIYKGGLELTDCYMFSGNSNTYHIKLYLANVDLYKTQCTPKYIDDLRLDGNMKIENSSLFSGTVFQNTNVVVNGENLLVKLSVPTSYAPNTDFMVGVNATALTINSNVELDRVLIDSFSNFQFIKNNTALTTVHIYGSFHANVTGDIDSNYEATSVLSYNSSLTDLYFHNDDFSITSSGANVSIFASNNANFKIHGISGGNVEAYCTANSIPFEVIPSE